MSCTSSEANNERCSESQSNLSWRCAVHCSGFMLARIEYTLNRVHAQPLKRISVRNAPQAEEEPSRVRIIMHSFVAVFFSPLLPSPCLRVREFLLLAAFYSSFSVSVVFMAWNKVTLKNTGLLTTAHNVAPCSVPFLSAEQRKIILVPFFYILVVKEYRSRSVV